MGDTVLVEKDDCSIIINLRDRVKNMAVDCWSNNCGIVFRRTTFEGKYRSESVIFNYCSCRVCDLALTKLTSSSTVFDAVSVVRKFRRAGRTFVDHTTRFYLRGHCFNLM